MGTEIVETTKDEFVSIMKEIDGPHWIIRDINYENTQVFDDHDEAVKRAQEIEDNTPESDAPVSVSVDGFDFTIGPDGTHAYTYQACDAVSITSVTNSQYWLVENMHLDEPLKVLTDLEQAKTYVREYVSELES